MQRSLLLMGTVLILLLNGSCSKDYREISALEITKMLPELKIDHIEVVEGEFVRLHVADGKPYQVDLDRVESEENFVSHVKAWNENASVEYVNRTGSFSWAITFYQLLPILFLLLIILHIVLLWLSLKKIIKRHDAPMEKLVHLIMVLFAPVIGPIVFLSTKKSSNYPGI